MPLPPISYDASPANIPTATSQAPYLSQTSPPIITSKPFPDLPESTGAVNTPGNLNANTAIARPWHRPSSAAYSYTPWHPVVSAPGNSNAERAPGSEPGFSQTMPQGQSSGSASTEDPLQATRANKPTPPSPPRSRQSSYSYTPWRPSKHFFSDAAPRHATAPEANPSHPGHLPPSSSTSTENAAQGLSLDERNNVSDRISDVIRGTNGAFASFDLARTAWQEGRYEDTFYDTYRGISNSMRAFRGVFVLAGIEADQEGNKGLAKSLKDTAANIDRAHRWLDGLLYPLSGFRDVASTFTDPSSTGLEKATSVADHVNVSGQFIGLAIPKLDFREGDTALKQFGYGMTTLLAGIYGARNSILGYDRAVNALGEKDYVKSAKNAIGATQDLVENLQYVVDFMADTFKSHGYKNLAEILKGFSTNLLDIGTAVYLAQALVNGLTAKSK